MQNVLGSYGLLANTAFGKSDVLGNTAVEVMRDHQHIERFVQSIYRVRPRRTRGRRDDIRFTAHSDDVRSMAATGSLAVKGMNGSALERCDGPVDETALVQRVGMNENLDIHLIGDRETAIDGAGGCSPVFVELQPAHS